MPLLPGTRKVTVEGYAKDLRLYGRLPDVESVSMTVEHNGVGTASVTAPIGHARQADLAEPGARLVIDYLDHVGAVLERLSGMIVSPLTVLNPKTKTITYTVVDDAAILRGILAWPVPGSPLASQTAEYDVRNGPVDQVVAGYVQAAIARLGLPITVAPAAGTGVTVTGKARMQPLMDVIRPLLEETSWAIRVYQWRPGEPVPAGLALTTTTVIAQLSRPAYRPHVEYTPVLGLDVTQAVATAPTATRAIVGGSGEGTARVWAQVVDAPLETQWGPLAIREQFVDARDTGDAAVMSQRGNEAVHAGAPTVSLNASIRDGDPYTYGVDYRTGDLINATVPGLPTSIEIVRATTIGETPEHGITVAPQLGDAAAPTDPDRQLVRGVKRLADHVAALESRR